jgi:hypothetical protein
MEGWTHECCSILGWIEIRGERPIKHGIAGFLRNIFKYGDLDNYIIGKALYE